MNKHNYKPGDKVRFIDAAAHRALPWMRPAVGTVGTVMGDEEEDGLILVQWPLDSTAGNGEWYCGAEQVEPVEEDEA